MNVQCRALVNWVKKLGFIAITLHKEVFSGKTVAGRNALLKAIKRAQIECTSLVVTGHTRLLRHPLFDKRGNCQITPTEQHWNELHKLLGGVQVYTLNSPSSSNSEEEQFLKRLHSECSKRGRPTKTKKTRVRDYVRKLFSLGLSPKQIASKLNRRFGGEFERTSIWRYCQGE